MFYGLHTTKKTERDAIMADGDYKEIEIDPSDFHYASGHLPIVIEEGSGKIYCHTIKEFDDCLALIDRGIFSPERTDYYRKWNYKGDEPLNRLERLPELYNSIKENGITEPVCCEATGERLDGSFRTKIALHLGIKKVKAREYRFKWQDINEDFINRKLKAREASTKPDYYQFSFGYKDWVNVRPCGNVYSENAFDRWEVLKHIIKGKTILDLGCNEGYIALQLARMGKKVIGVDHDWIHIANLNRLIYEYIDKKDLKTEFIQDDVLNIDITADTILMLCFIYHLPKDEQIGFLKKFKGKTIIFQCNLRKMAEREKYYGSHPDDLAELLKNSGFKIKEKIDWRDKPVIIAQ
jgi:SAM-dependent methyltransferase